MVRIKDNSIFHANILYLIGGLLLVFVGSIFQSIEIYSGLLITEYILVLIPSLIYIAVKRKSFKETLKLNKISFKQIGYIIGISLFTYPVAIFLNLIVLTILSLFGELTQSAAPLPDTLPLYLFSLFVISITPAICEEVMFRGVIMDAYENLSKRKAIIISAFLFGIYHINIQNLIGPILLGIVFGITVYKTDSIFAGIIGHGINNAIALTIGYFASKAENMLPQTSEVAGTELGLGNPFLDIQLLMSIVFIGLIAFLSYRVVRTLLKGLPLSEGGERISIFSREENNLKEEVDYGNSLHYIPLAVFFVIFLYINISFAYI